jgi:DNA-binding NtrC family response regulator
MDQPPKQITVLHIDQDRDFLEVSRSILTLFGDLKVDFAYTAQQAEQLLKKQTYDVVVCAFYLNNNINGLDFMKQLKQAGVKSQFILFTVNSEADKQATAVGIPFVGKYGDPEEVFAQLHQIMKISHS